ncbi:uncharacterized protein (TIGR02284 family) [Flavobacterium sp. CG_23.5]|uniref:PA2169 family four-helix-bundle protein n=1 Tax=unclassified Flavobacterium TaxID=196869 RepID=UPI0018CA3589|nr:MULTISPECIES: PA2169 family four-helix-bundle protein [unclassified Flavobacterium]MBG6111608.1 uncharacterized protein (TIGR02284 family) [Flavobacterium sp. CG_9.10]MBP2282299.1 uncharacterized protein (TIGR02284 family) [Flavobacterium sp. CG_23.5]
MNADKTIEVLNTFIEINNDRIEGYKVASKGTEKYSLKSLFFEFQQTSRKCKSELIEEVKKLGGIPKKETKIKNKFLKFWSDFKVAFICKDSKDIIHSCERVEYKAVRYYNDVLLHHIKDLNFDQEIMLRNQYILLNVDNDKVKALRDVLSQNKYFR